MSSGSAASGSMLGSMQEPELPDVMEALECAEEQAQVVPGRLGNRVQFDKASAVLSCVDVAGAHGYVKQELRDDFGDIAKAEPSVEERQQLGLQASGPKGDDLTEQAAAARLELASYSHGFYSKIVSTMAHTSVAPPAVPQTPEEDMAMPVSAEGTGDEADGDGDQDRDPGAEQPGEAEPKQEPADNGDNVLAFQNTKGINDLSVADQGAINEYVEKLADETLHDNSALGTMRALHRCLTRHSPNVVGKANFDVQLAFHQLDSRCEKGLIALYKAVKNWLESHGDVLLYETLRPVARLLPYLMKQQVCISEKIRIALMYAVFHGPAKDLQSIPRATETFDETIFELHLKIRGAVPRVVEEATVSVKTEKNGPVEAESDRATPPFKRSKTRRTKRATDDIHVRAPAGQTPVFYFSYMLSKAAKQRVSSVPEKAVANAVQAYDLMVGHELIGKQWALKEKLIATDMEDDTFSEASRGSVVIAKCTNHVEGARPPTNAVRQARSITHDLLKQASSPASELARTMQARPLGKAFMGASRVRVQQSIGDDAATGQFDRASKAFQEDFAESFEDLDARVAQVRTESHQVGYANLNALLNRMGLVFTSAHGSTKAWSTAACHANLKFIAENLNNCTVLLEVGKYMLVDIFSELIIDMLPGFGDALVIFSMATVGDDAATAPALEINKLKADIEEFTSTAKLMRCANMLHKRVGGTVFEHICEDFFNPGSFEKGLIRMTSVLKNMAESPEFCAKLVEMRKIAAPTRETHEKSTNDIAQLAGMVNFMKEDDFVFDAPSAATRKEIIEGATRAFKAFVEGPGPTG
ncbi:unnamed protein product [Prorocentrum cordatum]|uniref:Uncharacterized protein n=1 Tax=Prorocentrum cordatum TaxID=2364126 RepID=A0ABN9VG79_9DINO|nr:unnamed protein product [Polarella glacialis]